jgi:hypothetical protein
LRNERKGYFLLDAVLGTLILSLLLSVVLFSLQTSLRGFRKINRSLFSLYLGEKVLFSKFLLGERMEDQGNELTPYGEFDWSLEVDDLEPESNFEKIDVFVREGEKIHSSISALNLKR